MTAHVETNPNGPGFDRFDWAITSPGDGQITDCSNLTPWAGAFAYGKLDKVRHNGWAYQANWWTQNQDPEENTGRWQVWELLGICDRDSFSVGGAPPGSFHPYFRNQYLYFPVAGRYTIAGSASIVRTSADTSGGGDQPVTVRVVDAVEGDVPQLQFVSPEEGETVDGTLITLDLQAQDPDGSVERVAFYFIDSRDRVEYLTTVETPPFTHAFNFLPTTGSVPAGPATIRAVAMDDDGHVVEKDVDITVEYNF